MKTKGLKDETLQPYERFEIGVGKWTITNAVHDTLSFLTKSLHPFRVQRESVEAPCKHTCCCISSSNHIIHNLNGENIYKRRESVLELPQLRKGKGFGNEVKQNMDTYCNPTKQRSQGIQAKTQKQSKTIPPLYVPHL